MMVTLYDLRNYEQLCAFETDDWVYSISISPDGKYLATCGDDKKATLYDLHSQSEVCKFKHSDWLRSIVFSPTGTKFAAGGEDKKVAIYDCKLLNPDCQELCKYLKAANNFGSLIILQTKYGGTLAPLCNRFSLSSLKTTPEEEVIFCLIKAGKHHDT